MTKPEIRMSRPRRHCSFVIGVSFILLRSSFAQLTPEQELATFQTDRALRISLVAAEPLVASPCALAFDEKGRLFVAENRGYPSTAEPPQGVVALLEDTDGDGRMDKRTVFADGLTFPNGVLPWKDGVIVTCAPDVLFLRDTDGDGRADERRVLLTGFATTGSTQLRVNAPTVGPDGWIYLAAGLSGGTITCPEHPERHALKMTADVRFHPDTLVVENVDGRSQFGMSFDEFGRRFICMNRVPVQHVVLSSKWLARNPRLAFSDTVQDCSERSVRTGLKGGGDGVRLFPISANLTTADSHAGTFSAACGIHILQGESLGLDFRDCAFSCDPTGNLVHVDKLTADSATFTAKPLLADHELLASRDDWFRPVFLAPGPDGGLYIADMYRKVIEHPDYLPEAVRGRTDFDAGKEQGRIWRVTLKTPLKIPIVRELAGATMPELVKAMDSQTGWAKATTVRLLLERREAGTAEALVAALTAPATSATQYRRARLLGALGAVDDARLAALLQAGDVGIKRAGLELAVGNVPAGSAARAALVQLDERVDDLWFLQLIALGGVDDWRAFARFAEWSKIRSEDRWVRAAVLSGIGDRDEEFLGALKTQSDFAVVARLFAELRGLDDTSLAREIFERAATEIAWQSHSTDNRQVFARLLGRSTWAAAGSALTAAFAAESDDHARAVVAANLVALDARRAASVLLAPRAWAGYAPGLREAILNALLARRGQLDAVVAALESGALPVSALSSQRRELLTKHADAGIRERAAKLVGVVETDRTAAAAHANAALLLEANAGHGRAVFKQLCASCHRLEREGVAVGPDLLDIRNQPKENIVFHIVAPDAEIAPAFAAYACETKDGRSFAGILTSETASSVTLRQPGGLDETVLRADIRSLTALPGSLMPAGLTDALMPQDLADLLAFLKGEK